MFWDLFVSYSHDDKPFVETLAAKLEKGGVNYFLDEKEVGWGLSIGTSVRGALGKTAGVLLVLSKASIQSAWVPFEIGYAASRGRAILPLLIDAGASPPGYLGDIRYLTSVAEALDYFRSPGWKEKVRRAMTSQARSGLTITELAEVVGLVDIEDRALAGQLALPPEDFYRLAHKEVAISGVTLFRTFDQNLHLIQELVNSGKRWSAMILHPRAPIVPALADLHNLNIKSQIEDVISRVESAGLNASPLFELRCLQYLPPFTAVMIDGDLNRSRDPPDDVEGQIRVQPATQHQTQHRGMVYQFRKVSTAGGFNMFAADLRDQWAIDARHYAVA